MTSQDDRRAERVARGMMQRDAFSQWLGIEIVDIAAGRCTCRMTVRAEMVNGFGVGHGGIVFSLADSAFAFACNSSGFVTMSIDNTVTYPRPVAVGDMLTAVASEEAASKRISYYRAEVRNQRDEVVAMFRGTAYRTDRQHAEAD